MAFCLTYIIYFRYWEMIKRSNFRRSKLGVFQEIEIISKLIRRSKVSFFMRSKVFIKYFIIIKVIKKALGDLGD